VVTSVTSVTIGSSQLGAIASISSSAVRCCSSLWKKIAERYCVPTS